MHAYEILQGYRHVDGVSFKDLAVGEKFISEWQANPGLQRSALMFGKVILNLKRCHLTLFLDN